MIGHPYKELPDSAFWRRSVSSIPLGEVDPAKHFNFKISRDTKVATAGSCFAQHIARYLQQSGFNYYITERAHPILSEKIAKENSYGLFSARYGNIYTARQLLQMIKRAFDLFSPEEGVWRSRTDASVYDPFRPTVQSGGFCSECEMLADRKQHLNYVKKLFENLDVFVFTLGLTECWRSRVDGAVFPLCPGVGVGEFAPDRYEFYNQSVFDVVFDMEEFISILKEVNPKAKIVLTVSPVPLMATAQPDTHVLTATTYSKSVLRVAADIVQSRHENVFYFPSYEIITSPFNRGEYFAQDLRNVTESGVAHVMRLFLKHAAEVEDIPDGALNDNSDCPKGYGLHEKFSSEFVKAECDEERLDEGIK